MFEGLNFVDQMPPIKIVQWKDNPLELESSQNWSNHEFYSMNTYEDRPTKFKSHEI